jgi:hypothetical protein
MYEYKCKKCKKFYDYHLKLHHACSCGGELKEIIHRTPCYPKLDYKRPASYTPIEFEPVRHFGGFGSIWYYRKKRKGKLKL